MSFREKSAWIAIGATLLIWGYYFAQVGTAFFAGILNGNAIFALFLWCFGITMMLLLALNLLSARLGRQQFGAELDEREKEIERRAKAIEAELLEFSVIAVAIVGLLQASNIGAAYPADPAGTTAVVIANAVLFVVLFCQVVHEAVLIVQFRMMD